MKFTISTKPLKNATNLGIIKANISKYYYRSSLVQLTADRDTLKINIEAAGIKTRMVLHGSGDTDETCCILVECAKFKTLLDSIENDIISLEFSDGSLCVHAGTSKFVIPQMINADDMQLDEPMDQYTGGATITMKPANWQFIKDHQLFAIATKEDHPVYTNVWVGQDHTVIVGDMDLSLFTFSKKGDFDTSCLFPTSLVNLFASIPEGSTVTKVGKSYVLNITTDSYSLITEFAPKYEEDEAVGSYNSEIILSKAAHPRNFITVDIGPIIKFLGQTALFRVTDLDKVLEFAVADGKLTLTNKSNSYSMAITTTDTYSLSFNADLIKSVLSNFDADRINIAPMPGENNTTVGCIFWTDNLTVILAGVALK